MLVCINKIKSLLWVFALLDIEGSLVDPGFKVVSSEDESDSELSADKATYTEQTA